VGDQVALDRFLDHGGGDSFELSAALSLEIIRIGKQSLGGTDRSNLPRILFEEPDDLFDEFLILDLDIVVDEDQVFAADPFGATVPCATIGANPDRHKGFEGAMGLFLKGIEEEFDIPATVPIRAGDDHADRGVAGAVEFPVFETGFIGVGSGHMYV